MEANMTEELLSNDTEVNEMMNDENNNKISNPNRQELTEEDIRLGSKTPLKTVCILSIGPLLSQLTNALYGVVNTIWISKALGDPGLSAISTYQNFEWIGRSFAVFLQVSATTKISSLFGEAKKEGKDLSVEISQVLTDLLRFSLVCALITPSLFIPISKICVKWFGAEESIIKLGFNYIVPNLCLSIIPCFFLIGCGCLQAEGRSWLFSITQISALCLNMFVFCPMFLLGFKTGIAGAAYATGLAEFIPGLVVMILFYRGKFGIKPKLSQMLNKFSPHSFQALELGLAQLIFQISWCIPGIVVRKIVGLSCDNDANLFSIVMAGFNAFNRIWPIEVAVPNAINIGFIPAAAYAYGAARYMRVVWLLFHALWISVIWCSTAMVLTMGFPTQLAKIFSNTPEYLYWAKRFLFNGNVTTCVSEIPGIITSLLQAMKKGKQASVLSFLVQFLPVPFAVYFLYLTDKHNIARLLFCYAIQTGFGVTVSIPFVVVVLREIFRKHKEQVLNGQVNEDDINGKEKELDDYSISNNEQLNSSSAKSLNESENLSNPVENSLKKDTNGNDIADFKDTNEDQESLEKKSD